MKYKKIINFSSSNDSLNNIDSNIGENELNSEPSSSEDRMKKRNIKSSYLRIKNKGNLVIGNININSISSKFDQLKLLVEGNIDILVVTESIIDESFPTNQFLIDGFAKTYRLDRNQEGNGIFIYIREVIPCKPLKLNSMPSDIEGIFLELNLINKKSVFCGCYNPSRTMFI